MIFGEKRKEKAFKALRRWSEECSNRWQLSAAGENPNCPAPDTCAVPGAGQLGFSPAVRKTQVLQRTVVQLG